MSASKVRGGCLENDPRTSNPGGTVWLPDTDTNDKVGEL